MVSESLESVVDALHSLAFAHVGRVALLNLQEAGKNLAVDEWAQDVFDLQSHWELARNINLGVPPDLMKLNGSE